MNTKILNIGLLCAILIAVYFIAKPFFSTSNASLNTLHQKNKNLYHNVKTNQQNTEQQIQQLVDNKVQLQKKNIATNLKLQKANSQIAKLKMQSLENVSAYQEQTDTIQKLNQCDSLTTTINDLVIELDAKDSLLDTQQLLFDTILLQQDSSIQIYKNANQVLQVQVDTLIKNNLALEKLVKTNQRKLVWNKITHRLETVTIVAFAGIVSYLHFHPNN